MKRWMLAGLIAWVVVLAACEAAVTPNEYRDYTPPKIVAMYPSADTIYVYSNASFYIQFDDRMDPAIAAFDSDALILENISVIPPQRIPLTFQLVNADTCLLATFDLKVFNNNHVHRLRMTKQMCNFSRLALPQTELYERGFLFHGLLPESPLAFTLTSHTNGSWGGREIHLSGTCSGIETISVAFAELYNFTEQTFRLPYGTTNWSVTYPVNTALLHEESYKLTLTAAPYAIYRRLQEDVMVRLDLQDPLFMIDWPYAPGLVVTNGSKIKGIAVDNQSITNISIRIGTNSWMSVPVTLDWYKILTTSCYSNGDTTLEVRVVDQAGNSSQVTIPVIISNY